MRGARGAAVEFSSLRFPAARCRTLRWENLNQEKLKLMRFGLLREVLAFGNDRLEGRLDLRRGLLQRLRAAHQVWLRGSGGRAAH